MISAIDENLLAIDIVCNAFTPEALANGWMSTDPDFHKKVKVKTEHRNGVSPEKYIEMMDRSGIERSFLIASRSGDINIKGSAHMPTDYIATIVNKYPQRFSGLIGIDPSRIMESLSELEHAILQLGFVGAHLYPHWFEEAPDASKYYPFYAKCCELNIPIQMQVGHCLVYNPHRRLPTVGHPLCLDQIAIDFPELKIVGIHIGYPWYEEMISIAWKHQNVFIGLDAYAPKHWPVATQHYMNTFGQDKVLFGTDWPVVDPERAMEDLKQIAFKPGVKGKILRSNAEKLYSL